MCRMVAQVKKHPNEITIVVLGMLSNVARACELDRTFAANVKVNTPLFYSYNGRPHKCKGLTRSFSDTSSGRLFKLVFLLKYFTGA